MGDINVIKWDGMGWDGDVILCYVMLCHVTLQDRIEDTKHSHHFVSNTLFMVPLSCHVIIFHPYITSDIFSSFLF